MTGKLKAAAEIIGCFVKDPGRSGRLLRELPFMARSGQYAGRWEGLGASTSPAALDDSRDRADDLRKYFEAHHTGPGIWKWLHYFEVYERHLRKFRGTEVHVLEIGIYSGGSLRMWRDYFGPKCRLYGVDIQEACKTYENEWTRIFIGDQADREFWATVRREVPKLTVVIDDGGHRPEQQIVTLEELLPHLQAGGVYICEDIHRQHNWFAAYVQSLASELNAFHDEEANGTGSEFTSKASRFQSRVHSIHSYPFVSVVETREAPVQAFISATRGTEWQPFSPSHSGGDGKDGHS